jgi:hypothetical protein
MKHTAVLFLSLLLTCFKSVSSNTTTATTTTTGTSQDYCNCQYNVPYEAEADCRSYGQLGDSVLIPWYRSNQTCLDEYQIKVVSMDRETLFDICPYENSTNVDIQLFLNAIRYNPSPATRAIQAFYPMFWIESNTTAGSYMLVDVISDNRNNPNCLQSQTLCYNTIREYFTINPTELGKVCQEFHARNRLEMDLEQSTIRIRLCQEGDTTTSTSDGVSVCEPLVSQIRDIKTKNPSKACSAFGLGPGTQAVPSGRNCGTNAKAATSSTNNQIRFVYGWYVLQLSAGLVIILLN